MATFKVDHCFVLESRNLFVLAGEIAHGEIGPGMKIRLGRSQNPFEAEIAQLEFLKYSDSRPEAQTAICLRYVSDEQLTSFHALDLAGQTLNVA